jgi:hypothetical protein
MLTWFVPMVPFTPFLMEVELFAMLMDLNMISGYTLKNPSIVS